jgi:NADH:ubiquinone oxidoreductase subunit D
MFEEREILIGIIESISGARLHAAFILIGRLRHDIPNGIIEYLIH